ncbi:molybdopterin dehydrogenase FAD-binding protein [Thermaerobacter marianensis DSM 12885]|uniref:Molybdopterin dehydrogenase FAD-binding protein n=1 Tax=Thermaerobacter marianensis (strain ATCC 700841 / DSM 12885 / JCM 10246 / 7p75a) TaxID=644966 RepID=E6SH36_THEM7|nr:xanthine dehydrogenase family protein subunit M [Thermaerobacter marianensis]ADU50667.1 molybdopterin dehydrogenase FAD-binding protein [Thermaerobacter marianensis DSM 12885]
MIPSAFTYHRPQTLEEVFELLGRHGDQAKLLAGGHSLLPAMKLRLAQPQVLIDLGRVRELAGVSVEPDGALRLGALTTHHQVMTDPVVRRHAPLLAEVAGVIGDMQVRYRGTLGGSIAHADPAADYPAALLALEAEIEVAGPGGRRTVPAGEFFFGPFITALQPDEVVTAVRIPAAAGADQGWRWGYRYLKMARRASDFALVGVAAAIAREGQGAAAAVRVALNGVTGAAYRAAAVEEHLAGRVPSEELFAEAAARAVDGVDVDGDALTSAEYRAHLARVYTRRALAEAWQRAGGQAAMAAG